MRSQTDYSARCTSALALSSFPTLGSRYRETAGDAGFEALATTSLGLANMLGRADSVVMRGEVIANCRDIASATELPVNADLENCFRARRRPRTARIKSRIRRRFP